MRALSALFPLVHGAISLMGSAEAFDRAAWTADTAHICPGAGTRDDGIRGNFAVC